MIAEKKGKASLYWVNWVVYPTEKSGKIYYDNHTGESNWQQQPTYTKEIVIIIIR